MNFLSQKSKYSFKSLQNINVLANIVHFYIDYQNRV